jgi:DNA processing protein
MNRTTENAAMVALLRAGGRPWQLYADLVEEAGSAHAVLERELAGEHRQTNLFEAATEDPLPAAATEIESWEARGWHLHSVLDRGYPENLRGVHDRPPLIFVAGELSQRDARSIAVVGTRQPSPEGVDEASAIAEHLVASGYTVASGLASGIDTAAHTAALNAKGRTIAVLGNGLEHSYPPRNATLQQRIAAEGALISQFWPNTPPTRRSFPMRNAVMSGLTLATVVVEALHRSGARTQARLALAHGRPVLITRRLHDEQAWAREFATRPGTHVVGDPTEITVTVERLTSGDQLVA